LFHNLRSSFETELLEQFPTHVVAAWLGHSVTVMLKHYAQVTSEHFDRAGGLKKSGAKTGAVVVQKPVQQGFVPSIRLVANSNVSVGAVGVYAIPCEPVKSLANVSNGGAGFGIALQQILSLLNCLLKHWVQGRKRSSFCVLY
jgi:hypothetical protein